MAFIDKQRELWLAMSELYLDTDTRVFVPRLARVILESEIPLKQVEEIWRFQVTPSLCHNLFTVAGEWAAFPPDWLFERVGARAGKPAPRGSARRWREAIYRLQAISTHLAWQATLRFVPLLAELPKADRRNRESQWTSLAMLYFWQGGGADWSDDVRRCLAETAISPAELERVFLEECEPIFRDLLERPSKGNPNPKAERREKALRAIRTLLIS